MKQILTRQKSDIADFTNWAYRRNLETVIDFKASRFSSVMVDELFMNLTKSKRGAGGWITCCSAGTVLQVVEVFMEVLAS